MLIVGDDPTSVESALVSGALCCPACGGQLAPWGFARQRAIRFLAGERRMVLRRSLCRACRRSHVLVPASILPRRADATEVVGAALLAKAAGMGYRRVAACLGRPPSTVRNWFRTFSACVEKVRNLAARRAERAALNLFRGDPRASLLADALEALGTTAADIAPYLGPPLYP